MPQIKYFKTPIIGLNSDSPDHELPPGFFREIWNAQPKDGFSKSAIESLKGTTLQSNSLAAGTNTIIGAFTNVAAGRIFYFVHNSNDDHSIWYFDASDDTHTLVLQTEYLNFDTDYPILSCDFMEDLLLWTDNNNEPRSIMVSRAVAGGFYTFSSQSSFEKQCSLYKVPPKLPPTIPSTNNGRSVGSITGTNNITSDSYQFLTQYVYWDNCVSSSSPFSVLSKADSFPKTTETKNKIVVTQAVDSDLQPIIKKIRFIYQKNNDGDLWLFREVDADGSASYSVDFYNNDTTQAVDPAYVSFIPNKSKNLMLQDQRLLTTMNTFDYDDWDGGTLSIQTASYNGNPNYGTVCAPSASYSLGICYYDQFGRTNGVHSVQTVTTPNIKKALGTFTIDSTNNLHITYNLTGTPPPWATSYSIVAKKCNTYRVFWKGCAFIMFYVREGERETAEGIEDGGKTFYEDAKNGWTKQMYFKLPSNLPFTLDETFKLRILNTITGIDELVDIVSVAGDKIIIGDNMGITAWATTLGGSSGVYGMLNVALESYKTESEELFYEIGQNFDCSGGVFTTTSGRFLGDHHYVAGGKFLFDPFQKGDVKYGGSLANNFEAGKGFIFELPTITSSPTFSTITIEDTKTSVDKVKGAKAQNTVKKGLKVLGAIGIIAAPFTGGASLAVTAAAGAATVASSLIANKEETKQTETSTLKLVYTADLTKSACDFGRPSVIIRNKQVNNQPCTISISDKYVLDSNINNINIFQNLYAITPQRTPIRKLVDVNSSGVFLAIHERNVTSLTTYSGDSIMTTSDGTQLVGNGRGIIAYERQLAGGYGTIYPDSVIQHAGKVYFFDAYKGEVLRYSNAGLTPLAQTYRMANFFKDKGDQFVDPTGRNVISGYDQNLDILYLTFRSGTSSEEVTVAFVDRQGEERWHSFENFIPDRYASINNRLFSFLDGAMWEHNTNSTYNLFYGEQFITSLNHVFNPEYSKPKFLANITTIGNSKWDVDPITTTNAEYGDQETMLKKSNFTNKQGRFYVDVKRDVNTVAGLLPAGKSALVAGRRCVGQVFDITLENDATEKIELEEIEYGYISEGGHRG